MTYKFKVTKTSHYYGYPQAKYKFKVESQYFNATFTWLGNQGYTYPIVEHTNDTNGYIWSMHIFMRKYFNDELRPYFNQLIKEGDSVEFTLEN